MPLIRCSRCSQAYDVPGAIAVRLPNSIATCHCGEWLAGSKAAVLARMLNPEEIREVDLQPYRVDIPLTETAEKALSSIGAPVEPRSVRIIARGTKESVDTVFTIGEHPLWIGRQGCHVELAEAELSIRHCSIAVRGERLVVRDESSHTGTYLDGKEIDEAVIDDGVHLLRVGSALITIEPTDGPGSRVEPIAIGDAGDSVIDLFQTRAHPVMKPESTGNRSVLVCVEGALSGQEFEIPPGGLIVGREGNVRVPDEFLSRKHFEVTTDSDGTVRVRDLGSRNGTFLNTLPAHNTKVRAGDEIRAGNNRFKIDRRS